MVPSETMAMPAESVVVTPESVGVTAVGVETAVPPPPSNGAKESDEAESADCKTDEHVVVPPRAALRRPKDKLLPAR
jgi:hypothetical protein